MAIHNVICSVRNVTEKRIWGSWKVRHMAHSIWAIRFCDLCFSITIYQFFLFQQHKTERKGAKESPLKREVQAVKSILQGGSSSARDHLQSHQESHHSKDKAHHRHTRDDKAKLKKRNIFEVFKKPSNASEIDKPSVKQRSVIDKFELECIETLKVCANGDEVFFSRPELIVKIRFL